MRAFHPLLLARHLIYWLSSSRFCSYYVLMADNPDPRLLRLIDLADYEYVVVTCRCGRIVEYMPGFLQRRYRLSSTTLVYDLQYRLRCRHCRADRGFEIVIEDTRHRGYTDQKPSYRVIVPRQ